MLSIRQKVFFFVGLCLAIFGVSLLVLGAWATYYWVHGASGASMWCGIFLIMCGTWDIIIAIDQDPKQEVAGLSLSGLLVNMVALFMGIAIIGFASWAAWDTVERGIIYGEFDLSYWEEGGTEAQIEVYVSIVLLGGFAFGLALIALMADCCCGAFFEPGIPAPDDGFGFGGPSYGPQRVQYGASPASAYPFPQRY